MSALPNANPTASQLAPGQLVPGYVTPKARLADLRRRRTVRRWLRQLYDGRFRAVLIEAQRSQFFYKSLRNNAHKVQPLVQKINVIKLAIDMHASIQAGRAPLISRHEDNAQQAAAIADLAERVMLETQVQRVASSTLVDTEAFVRADVTEQGAVVQLVPAEQVLCVGPDAPDGQPTIVERRWIIEKQRDRRKVRYLRVERHRAGLVEHELYRTDSPDVLQHIETLKRVPLTMAIEQPPADRVETGVDRPLVTRFVSGYDDLARGGQPLISEHDLDQIDAMTKSVSRLHHMLELSGSPILRVGPSAIDEDGGVRITGDVVEDPEKYVDYITASLDLGNNLSMLERVLEWSMLSLKMSPSLLGSGATPGTGPITAEQVRTESMATLAFNTSWANYTGPAWSRALTVAMQLEAQLPGRGFAVSPVRVSMRPEHPKDFIARVREQAEALDAGLTDRRSAIAEIHGEAAADSVIEQIDADADAEAARARESMFGMPTAGGAA